VSTGALKTELPDGAVLRRALRTDAVPARARTLLLESALGRVEDVHGQSAQDTRSTEEYSPDFQVAFPYRGLFVWHVGGDEVIADSNQTLFIAGEESFRLRNPMAGTYAELIITPSLALLAEMAQTTESGLRRHSLFRRRSRRAQPRLQRTRALLMHRTRSGLGGPLAAEESMIAALRFALELDDCAPLPGPSTRRLIARAKEFLEASYSSPLRLLDVAREVGASPAYLTDIFRRAEGVPLHGYLTQLRLARALDELASADDLTNLALDLGFSSHSHFTAVFRRWFGTTPSRFRREARLATD